MRDDVARGGGDQDLSLSSLSSIRLSSSSAKKLLKNPTSKDNLGHLSGSPWAMGPSGYLPTYDFTEVPV